MINISDSKKKVFELTESTVLKSNRTFGELYSIFFNRSGTFAETSKGSRIIRYDYEYARDIISRLASAVAKLTSQKGRAVAICSENCPELLFTFWAVLKSGNKPYLINLRQPKELAEGILKALDANHVITIKRDNPFDCKEIKYEELLKAAENIEMDPELEFANEIYLTTSGTTLNQKICVYTGAEIAAQMLNSREILFKRNKMLYARCDKHLKMLMVLPLYHIFGLEVSYLWYSLFGTVFVFPETLEPKRLLTCIKKHRVTHIFAVPMLWQAIEKKVKKDIELRDEKQKAKFKKGYEFSVKLQNISPSFGLMFAKRAFKPIRIKLFGDSVRFMISGGAYIDPSTLEFFSAIGYPLCNGYGMTEVGVPCLNSSWRPRDAVNGNIGKPFNSVEMKIDEASHLLIRGTSVCKKQIINGEVIEVNDWFDTGDLATIDENGRFCITGRVNDTVINESGENLNPDVAQRYFDIPHVNEFCITGDSENKELVFIASIPKDLSDNAKNDIEEGIKKGMADLPSAYLIKSILYTYQPLSDTGDIKISRTKLRKKLKDNAFTFVKLYEDVLAKDQEKSELYYKLRYIISKVLEIPEEDVAPDSHFIYDLGGTSLDYYTVLAELESELGVKLSYEESGFDYTLKGFERAIEKLL